jgi:hypothetical protein
MAHTPLVLPILSVIDDTVEMLWLLLTSQIAITIYVFLMLFLMILTVVTMIGNETKRQNLMNRPQPAMAPIPEIKPEEKVVETIEEETEEKSRFFMLTQIDQKAEAAPLRIHDNEVTLEDLCEEFRHFAASRLKLFYDIYDIRRFIGGLSVSHIMILQGMSGTGKTSLAYAFCNLHLLFSTDNNL